MNITTIGTNNYGLENRMIDFEYLIENSINEIIAEAEKGRN